MSSSNPEVHFGGMVDMEPRHDGWSCVHTEPPAEVYVPSSQQEDVRVRIYPSGVDLHDRDSLPHPASVTSLLLRDVDRGAYASPVAASSVVFYALGALR